MSTNLEERAREYLTNILMIAEVEMDCAMSIPSIAKIKEEFEQAIAHVQTEAREQLAAWMIDHSFSTGHGDTFEDLLKELSWQVKELRGKEAEARLGEQVEYTPECWHFNNVSAKDWIDEYFKLRDKRIAELRAALAQAAAPAKEMK